MAQAFRLMRGYLVGQWRNGGVNCAVNKGKCVVSKGKRVVKKGKCVVNKGKGEVSKGKCVVNGVNV